MQYNNRLCYHTVSLNFSYYYCYLAELRDAAVDWDLWRKLTMTIAKALPADSTM